MPILRSRISAAALIVVLLGMAAPARTARGENPATDATVEGVVAGTAQLAVVGGTGGPGGTVAVEIVLSNDADTAAVSADLDIAYPADVVEFFRPVAEHCTVDARLEATHQVGGAVPRPGLLRFALFSATTLTPVGDGHLATCHFHILPGVAAGTTAALTIDFVALRGADGFIPVVGVPGFITITDVTPDPTPTETPIPPAPCVGDCNGNRAVSIAELIRGVGISLGLNDLSACPAFDANADGAVSISELITAVNRTLMGCGS